MDGRQKDSYMHTTRILCAVLGHDNVTPALVAHLDPLLTLGFPDGVLASGAGRTIRLAAANDKAALRGMARLPGDATGPMVMPTVPCPGCLHVVMTEGEKIIGDMVGHGALKGRASTNIQFWLDNAFVEPDVRRQGVGRAMGHAVLSLVERIREEMGLLRLGHPAGMAVVSGEADHASAGENLIFDMDMHASLLSDATQDRFAATRPAADTDTPAPGL